MRRGRKADKKYEGVGQIRADDHLKQQLPPPLFQVQGSGFRVQDLVRGLRVEG